MGKGLTWKTGIGICVMMLLAWSFGLYYGKLNNLPKTTTATSVEVSTSHHEVPGVNPPVASSPPPPTSHHEVPGVSSPVVSSRPPPTSEISDEDVPKKPYTLTCKQGDRVVYTRRVIQADFDGEGVPFIEVTPDGVDDDTETVVFYPGGTVCVAGLRGK